MHTAPKHFPANPERFEFDAEVTALFDNMALRAIPGYEEAHGWLRHLLAGVAYPTFAQVWDFGCSTGSGLRAAMAALADPQLDYRGCDLSAPMVTAAATNEYALITQHDLNDGLPPGLRPGAVAVAIFGWTLQFLPDEQTRFDLLQETYDALLPGGRLFVFEKFRFSDPALQAAADKGYYWWRRRQGYGFDEIYAKSLALQNSMFPWPHERLDELEARLSGASLVWLYRHYQFGGVVITKEKPHD